MGFHLGDIGRRTDAGVLRGLQREIACDCWFTSGGRTIPRIIKVMDSRGELHTVQVRKVLFSEEKNYAGTPTVEHVCRIALGSREETVKLVFQKEKCRWVLTEA